VGRQRGPLADILRKLKRAARKLEGAEREIARWLATNPCGISQESYPEACLHILRTTLREQPDPEWALEIGEAMGQVRSALDHLVQQLVTANGCEPTRNNAFPIYTSEKHFNRRKIKGVHPRWQAEIESLQPYKAANPTEHPLFRLNGLVQFDKHFDSHAIGVSDQQPGPDGLMLSIDSIPPDATPGRFNMIDFGWNGIRVDGAIIHCVYTDAFVPKARLHVQEAAPFTVAFGEGLVTTAEMLQLVRVVRKILARFEPAFR